jgi:hypothetical protein
MSRDNPWIDLRPPPSTATRPAARRVASQAGATGTVNARAFDLVAARFLETFRVRARRGYPEIQDALGMAREALVMHGTLTQSQAQRVQEWLVRDLEHLAASMVRGSRGAAAEVRAGLRRSPGALGSLLDALEGSEDAVHHVAAHVRGPELRRVGEVTCAGMLSCAECGRPQRLAASTQLEPCRGCRGTSYLRAG